MPLSADANVMLKVTGKYSQVNWDVVLFAVCKYTSFKGNKSDLAAVHSLTASSFDMLLVN